MSISFVQFQHADVDHPRLYNSERPKRVNEGSKNCENEKMEVEEREIVAPSSVLTHDLHLRSVYETGKFGEVSFAVLRLGTS